MRLDPITLRLELDDDENRDIGKINGLFKALISFKYDMVNR